MVALAQPQRPAVVIGAVCYDDNRARIELDREAWRALGVEVGERVIVEDRAGATLSAVVGERHGFKVIELLCTIDGDHVRVRRPNPIPRKD